MGTDGCAQGLLNLNPVWDPVKKLWVLDCGKISAGDPVVTADTPEPLQMLIAYFRGQRLREAARLAREEVLN